MLSKDKIEATVHYAASFIGGYFGIYALMVRSDNFGSSQTSNLIYIISGILGHNLTETFIRIGAALLYMFAIVLSVLTFKFTKFNLKFISMFINLIAVCILAFLPQDMDPILGLYPIFFAMAFQWNSFNGSKGYVSSTIFSTNNFRQFTIGLTEVLMGNKNNIERFKFFGLTLLCYHLGVIFSFMFWYRFSIQGIWFCIIPIIVETLLVLREVSFKNEGMVTDKKNISLYTKKTA